MVYIFFSFAKVFVVELIRLRNGVVGSRNVIWWSVQKWQWEELVSLVRNGRPSSPTMSLPTTYNAVTQ